jgi:hypothetical protein
LQFAMLFESREASLSKRPPNKLERLLASRRDEILEAVTDAEAELQGLEERRTELRQLILSARATLKAAERPEQSATSPAPDRDDSRQLTLHDAMARVLAEHETGELTAREIADLINEAELYRRRDGSAVEINQIHARANNYSQLFEKHRGKIRLRDEGVE